MIRRPWLGLALSLALHALVIALALLVVSRDEPLSALMVDLRDTPVPASVGTTARDERPTPPRAPRPRKEHREIASAPRRAPAPPTVTPAPTPPPAPVVEAPVVPPAPVVEPSREPSPAPIARPSVEPGPPRSAAGFRTDEAPAASSPGGGGAPGGPIRPEGNGVAGGSPTAVDRGGAGSPGERVASVSPNVSGGGGGVPAEYGPYLTALRQRIQQSVRYPTSARRRGIAGTVNVEILILANGSVGDVTLLESSSHTVLDEAALDTIRSLPRMPLPPDLPRRSLRVRLPVVFQMQ